MHVTIKRTPAQYLLVTECQHNSSEGAGIGASFGGNVHGPASIHRICSWPMLSRAAVCRDDARTGSTSPVQHNDALHRVLAREPEVAEIRMYQPAHVNSLGENCHNASTQRKGISHPRGKRLKSGQARPQATASHQRGLGSSR